MKVKRRVLSFMLALAITCSLCGCADKNTPNEKPDDTKAATSAPDEALDEPTNSETGAESIVPEATQPEVTEKEPESTAAELTTVSETESTTETTTGLVTTATEAATEATTEATTAATTITTTVATTKVTEASVTEPTKADEPKEEVKKALSMSEIVIENLCPNKYIRKKSYNEYAKDWREYTDGRNELEGGDSYYSSVCKQNLPMNVVLPQGYDDPENKDKKYPVLYVLHGFWGHRYSMMTDDKCDVVITNAIAAGVAEEMIVVYPHIFAFTDPNKKNAWGLDDQDSIDAYDRFVEVIAKDLMPYMAKNYRVAEGRENTAVFGFSMGGREALAIGFTYPDKFGYIAASCPAPGLIPNGSHVPQFEKAEDLVFPKGQEPYLLLIGAGDSDTMVWSTPKDYHNALTKNKVEHIYYEVKNSGHGNPATQSVCYNFIANIFRNSK